MSSSIVKIFWKFLIKIPIIGWRIKLFKSYREIPFPPGHYYSTTPDIQEIERDQAKIFNNGKISGIDLKLNSQLELLRQLKFFYNEYPYDLTGELPTTNNLRYNPESEYYRYSDAIFLFCMLRYLKPKKIIEIGSGHSSALMLDVNELFFAGKTELQFIEPYPEERLGKVIRKEDEGSVTVIKQKVQNIKTEIFQQLNGNDILFVDSSHVSKVGSDVNYIIFEILPELKPGVFIHFHDIFYPFELPKEWILKRRWFWNENYILRAFLMNNPDYEIILFNNFLHKKIKPWFEEEMPGCLIDWENTGSIWIKKIK